jgi:hypothetical protein
VQALTMQVSLCYQVLEDKSIAFSVMMLRLKGMKQCALLAAMSMFKKKDFTSKLSRVK